MNIFTLDFRLFMGQLEKYLTEVLNFLNFSEIMNMFDPIQLNGGLVAGAIMDNVIKNNIINLAANEIV